LKILIVANYPASDHSIATQLRGFAGGYRGIGHEVSVLGSTAKSRAGKTPDALIAAADYVHFLYHGSGDAFLTRAWKSVLRFSKPYGVTFEGHPMNGMSAADAGRQRRFLAAAAWATALSGYSADKLLQSRPYLKEKLWIVPNGLDQSVIDLIRSGKSRTSRSPRPFVFCASRQESYKGIDLLLWAWKEIRPSMGSVRLLIAGRNDERRHFRRLAKILGLGSSVRFLGILDRDRVSDMMRDCLFFVMPSRDETFGLAALEAMAFGKAVLATKTGPSEFIRNGRSGLLVAPKDVGALQRGLSRLLADGKLRKRLGREAARDALKYPWEASARRFERLMLESAGTGRRQTAAGPLQRLGVVSPAH
jgi:glycosyltransferase involved in cell wall biosynthesis